MKKIFFILIGSSILSAICHALGYHTLIKYIGYISLFVSLALSGVLISGDRMRANTSSGTGYNKDSFLYVFLFALPFLILNFT
ncbi:hypothetical protein EsVE80_04160 [Enterococcus saigonensis]|uniref:Uncharacterized protein n=1 Tax=Enterococcus saigonensis TaxID=1805431 RepID=A0A679I989_9ENTE|nr:DUF5316 family protein [Enterococcus saigonensis]BCA84893.1 hypothetical protein EsVE80_04160 [Enterococcus saigonensis]